MPPLTPITRAILIAMAAGFMLQQWLGDVIFVNFALWPPGLDQVVSIGGDAQALGFKPWQLVTYAFLHGGWMHLLFNGIALWSFGGAVETRLGPQRYLMFFTACVVGAAVLYLLTLPAPSPGQLPAPAVGASGGIYGVLLAFAIYYPRARMMLVFPPIPMPAWLLVALFIGADLLLGIGRVATGVAHFAHLGGALTGIALLLWWRRSPPRSPPGGGPAQR